MNERAVRWNESESLFFKDIGEMLKILAELDDRFSKSQPTIVEIEGGRGDSMAIGLGGGDDTLLSYIEASGDPPYLHSVGQYNGDDTVVYYYYGEWTEFPKRVLIPKNLALEVVKDFAATGQITNKVRWEED